MSDVLATVDLGSNSFRLLIARIGDDGVLYPIDRLKETVRLAGGLNDKDILSDRVQLKAVEVLSRFKERLVGFNKSQVRAVGTSTFRVAKNINRFLPIANQALGFKIEIISGNEEARLIYIGATHALSYSTCNRLIIDIGGGSTEFVLGTGYEPLIMESVTMGCVSYSDRYFPEGNITKTNFANAVSEARAKVQSMKYLFRENAWQEVIGTSGSAKALYEVCVSNQLSDGISLDALYQLKNMVLECKNASKLELCGLRDERKSVLSGGLAIMIGIMEELNITFMSISDGALREGLMYDLLGRKSDHDLRPQTVERLKKRYFIDEAQSNLVSLTACNLANRLIEPNIMDYSYIKLLKWASSLYEIGLSISHNDYHRHGAYILSSSDMVGFSKPEQSILADLVRAHRGNLTKAIESIRTGRTIKWNFYLLVLSFRVAIILCRNRKPIPEDTLVVKDADETKHLVEFEVSSDYMAQNPLTLYSLEEEIAQWDKLGFVVKLFQM